MWNKRIYNGPAGPLLVSLLGLSVGLSAQSAPPLPDGSYRGEFQTAQGRVPFNFAVKGTTAYLLNAGEREELTGIQQVGDSVLIPIPLYDAVLRFKRQGNRLTGFYRTGEGQFIPVTAEFGRIDRYQPGRNVGPSAPTVSLNGKWDIGIQRSATGAGDVNPTVGVFEQQGSRVTGTILTTTGDYRYLDGHVTGNRFELSRSAVAVVLRVGSSRVSGRDWLGWQTDR